MRQIYEYCLPDKTKTFAGFLIDNDDLMRSSSGGICTALSRLVVSRGGIVIGAKYSSDFKTVEYGVAESYADLESFRGSKYCETKKECYYQGKQFFVFDLVVDLCRKNKEILFIGLPCDVGALKFYINRKNVTADTLYTVDLICHGPVTSGVYSSFVFDMEKKYDSTIRSIDFRYKKTGWHPPYLHIEFENGMTYEEIFYKTTFAYVFSHYSKESCYHCKFKGDAHASDITVGDYWGVNKQSPAYNSNGVSVMVAHTMKGNSLLDNLPGSFQIVEIDGNQALQNNKLYFLSRKKSREFAVIDKYINDGFDYAVKKATGTLYSRIKSVVKRILRR